MRLKEFLKIDRGRIPALTGPIFVEGAEPGDVLQIDILEVARKGSGWNSVVNDLEFLKERFSEPYLFHWELGGEFSTSLAPAIVPLRPFCGAIGVATAEDGEFRPGSPGVFGGNVDVRELCMGATLYLPALNPGRFFQHPTLMPLKATEKFASMELNAPRAQNYALLYVSKNFSRGP